MDFLSISIILSAVIIGIIVLLEGLDREKVPLIKTIFAIVNIIVSVVFFAIYPTTIKTNESFLQVYFWLGIFEYAVLLMFSVILFIKLLLAKREMKLMTESVKNSPWNTYLILDKKERIKDISENLLDELNEIKENVLHKKLFEVINRSIRVQQVNNRNYTNRDLEDKFYEIKKISKPNELLKLEISFYNAEGDTSIVHMMDQAMFSKFGYYGRFLIGEMKTDFNLLEIEQQLKHTQLELTALQEKFIATLEVSQEGLAFEDLNNQTIWISERLMEEFGFNTNTIGTEDFLKLMQPDDLQKYLVRTSQLTPTSPIFEMKYRLFTKGIYRWYKGTSKRLFLENNGMLMSSIVPVNSTHFMNSNIQVLDELGDQNKLILKIKQLINEGRYFHFMTLRLKNLPYINEIHGRDVGNMAIAEYITKLKNSFASEHDHIYRLSGSTFGLIIDDQRKMSLIQKGVQGTEEYLNMTLEYGSSRLELDVYAGVSIINKDGYNENEMLETALHALKVAENPKYKGHVCYYGDL